MLKLKDNIGYRNSGLFPELFLDYVENKDTLKSFSRLEATLASLDLASQERNFTAEKRHILVDSLKEQYNNVIHSDATSVALKNLSSNNTFTITTGHQLNLFTGPLYFIYKILTAIKLAEACNKAYPNRNFVPIYWMASEDHDFDEINAFFFENKTYKWPTDQKGPVGRFKLDDIDSLIEGLPFDFGVFQEFYSDSKTLAEAHFKMVHHLFKDYGLIVIDPDNKSLKKLFSPVMKKDIEEGISFKKTTKSTEDLNKLGYKTQVHPREVNYFFINEQGRFRILKENEKYGYLNDEGQSIEIDLDAILKTSPESISPNVITRPIYQEYILPNLAYIGGPAEMAYWLQFKKAFDQLNIQFPIIFPRLSASLLSLKSLSELENFGVHDLSQIFLPFDKFQKATLLQGSDWNEDDYIKWTNELKELMQSVEKTLSKLDSTLSASAKGRHIKMQKELDKLRKKGVRAAVHKNEIAVEKLNKIHEELFPSGILQERKTNILSFLFSDENIIAEMYQVLGDPFQLDHRILSVNT